MLLAEKLFRNFTLPDQVPLSLGIGVWFESAFRGFKHSVVDVKPCSIDWRVNQSFFVGDEMFPSRGFFLGLIEREVGLKVSESSNDITPNAWVRIFEMFFTSFCPVFLGLISEFIGIDIEVLIHREIIR